MRLADDVRQHVQAAAMRHADDGFVHVGVGGAIQNFVQNRDGRFARLRAKNACGR